MAIPSRTTVTIDGNKFDAYSTNFGITTQHDGRGIPVMGSLLCSVDFGVDINDNVNMPYDTLQALFQMANIVTRDKVKEIKIEFWQDDSKTDAVCTYTFQGWINHFNISSSGGGNHILSLSVHPTLDKENFYDIVMGN